MLRLMCAIEFLYAFQSMARMKWGSCDNCRVLTMGHMMSANDDKMGFLCLSGALGMHEVKDHRVHKPSIPATIAPWRVSFYQYPYYGFFESLCVCVCVQNHNFFFRTKAQKAWRVSKSLTFNGEQLERNECQHSAVNSVMPENCVRQEKRLGELCELILVAMLFQHCSCDATNYT